MVIFLFVLGLAVGSFLNVLIDRLPKGQSVLGRSLCDLCKKKLRSRDLIPVISFILLKGRCRYCRKKISLYYPLVELLTAVMFVLVWIYAPTTNYALRIAYLGLFSVLIAIFFADLKYQVIPDELQIALFAFGFLLLTSEGLTFSLVSKRLFSGAIVMLPIHLLHVWTKGKGMGYGDVKLSFIIGFVSGLINGFIAVYFGFVLGAIVGIALLISGKKTWRSRIAFGPFLILGLVVFLIFQNQLNVVVKNLFGI